jgi:hypothetical protein
MLSPLLLATLPNSGPFVPSTSCAQAEAVLAPFSASSSIAAEAPSLQEEHTPIRSADAYFTVRMQWVLRALQHHRTQ